MTDLSGYLLESLREERASSRKRPPTGKIVLANDPVAADATCVRLMGFNPLQVRHLSAARHFLGNRREDRITMLAEGVGAPTRPFSVLPEFRYLLAANS
jgi:uncharacterized protein (DUF362 family)